MKYKAAFTKKDLVVVLGCVVFLLMNIGSVGSSGRRRAKEAVCLSNLFQWGAIFQMYTNEHDGYFMGGWYSNPKCPDCPSEHWTQSLRSYYGEPGKLTCCPEAAKKPDQYKLSGSTFEPWGLMSGGGSYKRGDYGSYGINTCIYNTPHDSQDFWRRADVAGADNIPIFLDALWTASYVWHTFPPPEYEGARWSPGGGGGAGAMGIFCLNRHNGGINGLFMDFSARKIGLKELWTLKWSRNFNTEGPWTIAGGVTWHDWANHGTGWMEDFKDF